MSRLNARVVVHQGRGALRKGARSVTWAYSTVNTGSEMNAKTKEEYDRAIEELKKVPLIGNDYDGAQEAFSKIRDIVYRMIKRIEEEK
jgi:hypothetical protein